MTTEYINHLIELRKRLIFIIIGIIICFLALFHFANDIYQYLSIPLFKYLPTGTKLIATDITSPFFTPLKITLYVALFISIPHTLFQIWQFIAPALYKHEKILIFYFIVAALVLSVLGMLFCYYIVLPTIFKFIGQFKSHDIIMLTDITKYLDFVLKLFLIFALAFQTPIVIFLLIYFDIVSLSKMKSLRRYVIVGCFVVAAIVTPPDVLSQTILAIPLYLFYELGMLFAKLIKSHKFE